jgi:hypothetical protein
MFSACLAFYAEIAKACRVCLGQRTASRKSVDAAMALLALMAAESGGHKTVDGLTPHDPA